MEPSSRISKGEGPKRWTGGRLSGKDRREKAAPFPRDGDDDDKEGGEKIENRTRKGGICK